MTFPGYLIETSLVDPVTGETIVNADAEDVVPEGADNLLGNASEGSCCGGSCCQ